MRWLKQIGSWLKQIIDSMAEPASFLPKPLNATSLDTLDQGVRSLKFGERGWISREDYSRLFAEDRDQSDVFAVQHNCVFRVDQREGRVFLTRAPA